MRGILLAAGLAMLVGCGKKAEPTDGIQSDVIPRGPQPTGKQYPRRFVASDAPTTIDGLRLEIVGAAWWNERQGGETIGLVWVATTGDDSRKYPDPVWDKIGVKITDDVGNTYKRRASWVDPTNRDWLSPRGGERLTAIHADAKKAGRELSIEREGTVTSTRGRIGSVIMEMPVRAAQSLTLTFNGRLVDLDNDFHILVPRDVWTPPAPKK